MTDRDKKDQPGPQTKYDHTDGKCNKDCGFYTAGYCALTGACMTTHTLSSPMMMAKTKVEPDCDPFLIDLRRNAEKNWPEYQGEMPQPIFDESVGEQILKELRKLNKNFKKHQEDMIND